MQVFLGKIKYEYATNYGQNIGYHFQKNVSKCHSGDYTIKTTFCLQEENPTKNKQTLEKIEKKYYNYIVCVGQTKITKR